MKFNKKNNKYYFCTLGGILFFCLCSSGALPNKETEDNNLLNEKIKLSNKKGTVYQMFRYLSEHYNCMFIYDSRTIENSDEAEIKQGQYSLREAIHLVTKNDRLILESMGRYVSIRLPQKEEPAFAEEHHEIPKIYFQIRGNLRDKETNKPIPYATARMTNSPVNTVTNQEGDFTITLHDSLSRSTIRFSHIGYHSLEIATNNLVEQSAILTLEPETIVLPEVHVRAVNIKNVMQGYFKNRPENYSKTSVNMDVFYREGIEQEKGSTELIEAVFKMYKDRYNFENNNNNASFDFSTSSDMVKLEKMRTMVFEKEEKFVDFKIRSGVHSLIQLDIVKSAPNFLDPHCFDKYDYSHERTTSVDEQKIHIISFQPKSVETESLYKGFLYVDAESKALVMARFEIHPKQIKEAEKTIVLKNSKSVNLSLKSAVYTVLYKEYNGIYYLNYVRVDINFSSRKRMGFSGRTIHSWIEMVCTDINTTDVKRFARNERFPTHTIFSKTRHEYDFSFWNNYVIIAPEERFMRLIHSAEIVENELGSDL
jgi:hypothetical protein